MKEFVVYTGLRVVLFAATLAIVLGAWVLIAGSANILAAIIISFLVSGAGSYVVLARPRARFAQRVEVRADRAVQRFEEARAREDAELEASQAAQQDGDESRRP